MPIAEAAETSHLARHRRGGLGNGKLDDDGAAIAVVGNIRADLDDELDFVWRDEFEKGEDAEWGAEVGGDAVVHDHELSVWRDEGQDALRVEVGEVHALMEVAVIDFHNAVSARCVAGLADHELR